MCTLCVLFFRCFFDVNHFYSYFCRVLLRSLLQENVPLFYDKVILNGDLTMQESQTCILCRLDFLTSEIAVLLGTTSQSITNAKISANQKLFGEKKASTLKNNLKRI